MNAEQTNNTIVGLKTEVSRQVGLKKFEVRVGDYTQYHLVNSWKLLYATGLTDEVTEMIWDYIQHSPTTFWKPLDSKRLGIYTTIGSYTNKKGTTSLAHFTENGNYIGSVAKLGSNPVSYAGNFRISRDLFIIDFSKLNDFKQNNDFSILFEPKM